MRCVEGDILDDLRRWIGRLLVKVKTSSVSGLHMCVDCRKHARRWELTRDGIIYNIWSSVTAVFFFLAKTCSDSSLPWFFNETDS